eukprot:g3337.t1
MVSACGRVKLLLVAAIVSLSGVEAATVDEINARFMAGAVSNNITEVGLIIHQFGATDDAYHHWEPCDIKNGSCWFSIDGAVFDDRVSCSVTSHGAPKTTERLVPTMPAGSIGLFSYGKGGVIVNPSSAGAKVMCSYDGDGGTETRLGAGCGCQNDTRPCDNPGCAGNPGGKKCVEPSTCTNVCPTAGELSCHQCAYSPGALATMLAAQRQKGEIYNELVLDATAWKAGLPGTIDAFFYPSFGGACASQPDEPGGCLAYTKAARADFLKSYPAVDPASVPLLALDATQTSKGPFTLAS